MRRNRQYYTVFDLEGDGSWYFYIPDKHTPFPGEGDMLCGPYEDHDQAYKDAVTSQQRAIEYFGE